MRLPWFIEPLCLGIMFAFVTVMPPVVWWALISVKQLGMAIALLGGLIEFTLIFAWCAGWLPGAIVASAKLAKEDPLELGDLKEGDEF